MTAALERLVVWDVRRGVEVRTLVPPPRESGVVPAITKIARASGSTIVAAGAADGSIRLWNLADGTSDVLLKGHKSEVTALRFNKSGSLLVSGGKDTSVVVWDVVAEVGLCRLRGHKDQVTDAVFVETGSESIETKLAAGTSAAGGARLVTTSKDGTLKVWDLETQHCAQTMAHFTAEVWSVDVAPGGGKLAVGTADERLHLFGVNGGGDGDDEFDAQGDDDEANDDENPTATTTTSTPKTADEASVAKQKQTSAAIESASALLTPLGFVKRADNARVSTLRFDERGTFLGCQTVGRAVEVYRVRDSKEIGKRLRRKAKRRREKRKQKKDGGGAGERGEHSDSDDGDGDGDAITAADTIDLAAVVRTKAKTRGFAFAPRTRVKRRSGVKCVLSILTDCNAVEEWEISGADGADDDDETKDAKDLGEPLRTKSLEHAGHRADVRGLVLGPDDITLVTLSHKGVKVWDPEAGSCARSVEGGYGLCALFAPGGRHVVVGTKSGGLEVIDTQAGVQLTGLKDAHAGPVWGIAATPNGAGFVTASADKTVKFFEWTLLDVDDEEEVGAKDATGGDADADADATATPQRNTRRELGLLHTKTLQMAEDVLSVSITPDGKLLSVSLLDNTLKVFFVDSLKFFLSLYGHRLPALCHDVSSDSRLLASGGADKNVRIWGLDFGDCHKSIFAHDDSVTALKFVPKTHYLFSAGKDGRVKYWDADKFEPLLTLNGHHASVWCLGVSARGDFVVSGGHDRAIRVWKRTDEPFFVDEEKERRLESLLEDAGGEDDDDDDRVAKAARDSAFARGGVAPAGAEAGMASRKTLETLSAADAIVDALDVARHERTRIEAHVAKKAKAALSMEIDDEGKEDTRKAGAKDTGNKLKKLFKVNDDDENDDDSMASDSELLDHQAVVTPYGENSSYPTGLAPNPLLMGVSPERYALAALATVKPADLERAVLSLPFTSALALLDFLSGWLEKGEKIELTCRLASLIVRLHYQQLGATANARGVLLRIRPLLRDRANSFRDVLGFNLAGLGMWASRVQETVGAAGRKRKKGDDSDDDDEDDEKDDALLSDDETGVGPGWG